ncbi:hypothetical protein MtrunA17_Chr4g0032961 [Medicago truncatula]|uniref:Transmembrane protein n=1 Tax=Medicago truncatula TaxID=3880 RepID=A0A396IE51_MEDTR|nr:hypothetical protein MtrunA17_Chr4g0032961 [Medicago truncatula]
MFMLQFASFPHPSPISTVNWISDLEFLPHKPTRNFRSMVFILFLILVCAVGVCFSWQKNSRIFVVGVHVN